MEWHAAWGEGVGQGCTAWFGMACFRVLIRVGRPEAIFAKLLCTCGLQIGVHVRLGANNVIILQL